MPINVCVTCGRVWKIIASLVRELKKQKEKLYKYRLMNFKKKVWDHWETSDGGGGKNQRIIGEPEWK